MLYGTYMTTFESLLGALRAVLGATLATLGHAGAVQRAAHRVVAHARQVLHAAAADQHHRVLLQVVAFAADVADDFEAVRQAHLRNFAQCGVRLLRRRGVNARAHAALLRACSQRRNLGLVVRRGARLAYELTDAGHTGLIPKR